MPGPLQGVRVLDLSVMISGPLATMILADQGAEVVKVESPGLGDIMRFLGTNRGGMTGIFANSNRGKRSLVLDLKQPAGVEVLHRLVAGSDVFIQNFRPGAMERLGLTYEASSTSTPASCTSPSRATGRPGPTAIGGCTTT
jgi:crotonobetainyl-CoA:carnitine CoA-transferase CaiB-like acyl-CoA transferase